MIRHKGKILIEYDATQIELVKDEETGRFEKLGRQVGSNVWSIYISGDVNDDNPVDAVFVLQKTQDQIDLIRHGGRTGGGKND